MILITGSKGLIGDALRSTLIERGLQVRDFDIARSPAEDIRNGEALATAIADVEGIIHLAAVSRIVWAERDPRLTEDVNVAPVRSLLAAASARTRRPWIIFASSREVYGEPSRLPVGEDAPFAPLNVYARSKVAAERLLADARHAGLLANIVRFSNVYGSPSDHPDRVVPAFAQAAVSGGRVRVEGAGNMFDFTHIDDVAQGMAAHVAATRAGEALPPIQFVTGKGTTLRALADFAQDHCDHALAIEDAPPRTYDVARFVGDPARARQLLGWQSRIDIKSGFAGLVVAYRDGADVAAMHQPGGKVPKT